MPLALNIIARTNGVGLDRDVDLVHEIASKAGHRVAVSHCRSISPLRQFFPKSERYDANIFLERIFTRWLGSARRNILIPNQERFPERHISRLRRIDHVFCKSQHALAIFQEHHPSCHFTGFTSKDLYDGKIRRKPLSFLHLAGRSTLKGTETILEIWQRRPDLPTLTLLQCEENAPDSVPDNVNLLTDYLPDNEIARLYNEHTIHLCPSRSEGWGHYIVEAMACKALVITTDGPPMNELVQPERGRIVTPNRTEARHIGTNYYADTALLEKAIDDAIADSPEHLASIGNKARMWTIENQSRFEERFTECLQKLEI
jgi:glycosyltransferase involved in cell wall biosynthesis